MRSHTVPPPKANHVSSVHSAGWVPRPCRCPSRQHQIFQANTLACHSRLGALPLSNRQDPIPAPATPPQLNAIRHLAFLVARKSTSSAAPFKPSRATLPNLLQLSPQSIHPSDSAHLFHPESFLQRPALTIHPSSLNSPLLSTTNLMPITPVRRRQYAS
jgi:hypothetical protein